MNRSASRLIRAISSLRLVAAASLVFWMTSAAGAQGCQNLRVADIRFCPEGTNWQNVRLVPEEKNGVVTVMAGQANRLWLVFSRIPRNAAAKLPSRPRHRHIVALLEDFAKTSATYSGALKLESFAPLGRDVAVASLATRGSGWINVYTYYAEGDVRLVVQTGDQFSRALTGDHRKLHIEAVRALMK